MYTKTHIRYNTLSNKVQAGWFPGGAILFLQRRLVGTPNQGAWTAWSDAGPHRSRRLYPIFRRDRQGKNERRSFSRNPLTFHPDFATHRLN
jgi:hypothetical protein